MQESADPRSLVLRLYAISALVAVVAFFVDQFTKHLGRLLPAGAGPFPQFATFVFHENRGLIANLPVPLLIIILMTAVALALVAWMLVVAVRSGRVMAAIGLSILIGGAAGNLMDRLTLGFVFDWLLLFGRSAFNVADLCILAGVLLYLAGTRRSSTGTGP